MFLHHFLVVTCRNKCCLVTNVCYVGTRESWCLTCQLVYVEILIYLHRLQVHLEYRPALVEVGQINIYLSVETSCTQQCRVEHIYTVCRCKDYDTAVRAEAVHLGEQGIQRILAFVVAAHRRVLGTGTSYCVNLVDEDDTRCLLLSLTEGVAHTTGTDTDEHLHEVGTRHREEGHSCLSGNGLRQQRLSCSRRSYEQRTLGNLSS